MIPVVGAYIGVTIGTILIMTHSVTLALLFVAYVVILQQFEGNFIYPYVVGGSTGLPGIWVIFAITIGSALGGILGMSVSYTHLDVYKRQVWKELASQWNISSRHIHRDKLYLLSDLSLIHI